MVLKNPLWTLLWTLFRCFARETSQHDTITLSEVLSQCHPLGRRGPEKFHGNQREAKTRPPALPLPKLCLSVTPGTLRKAPSWVPFSSLISPLKDSQSVSPRQLRRGQKRTYQGRMVSKSLPSPLGRDKFRGWGSLRVGLVRAMRSANTQLLRVPRCALPIALPLSN